MKGSVAAAVAFISCVNSASEGAESFSFRGLAIVDLRFLPHVVHATLRCFTRGVQARVLVDWVQRHPT